MRQGLLAAACLSSMLSVLPAWAQPTRRPGGRFPTGRFVVNVRLENALGAGKAFTYQWTQLLRAAGAEGVSESRRPGALAGEEPPPAIRLSSRSQVEVRAIVGPNGVLHIGKNAFSPRDRTQLAGFIAKLHKVGVPPPDPNEPLWGLNEEQLDKVQEALSNRVTLELKDTTFITFLSQFRRETRLDVSLAPAVQRQAARLKITCNLPELAFGSAASYALDTAGLAFEPRVSSTGAVSFRILSVKESARPWPVGVGVSDFPGQVVPRLLTFTQYETNETPLNEIVSAWQDHLGVAVLIQPQAVRTGLAGQKSTVFVRRTTVDGAMKRTLGPLGLKHELRVDESNRPFVLISSTKPTGPAARKPLVGFD